MIPDIPAPGDRKQDDDHRFAAPRIRIDRFDDTADGGDGHARVCVCHTDIPG